MPKSRMACSIGSHSALRQRRWDRYSRQLKRLRFRMSSASRIAGTGRYLPAHVMTNDALAQRVATSDEWIRTRTGILQRHIASDGEQTSDLALAASRIALEDAGIAPADLDLIVVATTTPDMI